MIHTLSSFKPIMDFCDVRRACGHVDVRTYPHQVLAATLTLSQPGGQIMPTLYWCSRQVLKATGAPACDTMPEGKNFAIISPRGIIKIKFGCSEKATKIFHHILTLFSKVHVFWEGHKNWQNLHHQFDSM